MLNDSYFPKVDDYVIWDQGEHGSHQGWVYFVADPPEVKKGFRTNPRYITIEIHVYPKKHCTYTSGKPMRHKMNHTLLLCNERYWHQLKFVKSRSLKDTQLELKLE
tara:strand:+ start:92 stop:409 length:318 start_codon:yes stop_codon:yes gene_type:complete